VLRIDSDTDPAIYANDLQIVIKILIFLNSFPAH
jgi:hypothetical protein